MDTLQEREMMLASLAHRGPDGSGTWEGEGIWLGHARLAVLDPTSRANQPLASSDGGVFLTYNGEIYHAHGQAPAQQAAGGDTRSLAELLSGEGAECLPGLDGMFAFGAYLRREHALLLARDPLGVKPLYYTSDGRTLKFASEMKALLQPGKARLREGPAGYFARGEKTLFEGIDELLPGHALRASSGPGGLSLDSRPYFSLEREVSQHPGAQEDSPLQALVERAVVSRMRSDVEVGVFLSGGLDSSLVAAIAAKSSSGTLKGFCVGMEEGNEIALARQAAGAIGVDLIERALAPEEVIEALPHVIYHLEDCDPRNVELGVLTYFLAGLARSNGVRVALTGEGADELFYGYDARYAKDICSREMVLSLYRTHLKHKDRATMAHGVEARVPFIDFLPLVRYALSRPREEHTRGGVAKRLLREAARAYLPADIAWREKGYAHTRSGIPQAIRKAIAFPGGGVFQERRELYRTILGRIYVEGVAPQEIRLPVR